MNAVAFFGTKYSYTHIFGFFKDNPEFVCVVSRYLIFVSGISMKQADIFGFPP